jgi:hypothetical protein
VGKDDVGGLGARVGGPCGVLLAGLCGVSDPILSIPKS